MRYAMVEDGKVLNVAIFDEPPPPESGWVYDPTDMVVPGDLVDGKGFRRPSLPSLTVPQQVTRAQGKIALIEADLLDDVLTYAEAIVDQKQRALAEVALHETNFWERSSPFLNQAAAALGWSDAKLDELFIYAAGVQV